MINRLLDFLHLFRFQFRRALRKNVVENRPVKPLRFISTRVNGESTYREVILSAYEDPDMGHLVLTPMSLMIVEKTRQEILCAEEAARQEWDRKFEEQMRQKHGRDRDGCCCSSPGPVGASGPCGEPIGINTAAIFDVPGAGPCAKGEVL